MMSIQNTFDTAVGITRMLHTVLTAEEVQHLLDETDRMETIMPIIDPTAYNKVAPNIKEIKPVFKALHALLVEIERAAPQ